jgi:hypothetical protein
LPVFGAMRGELNMTLNKAVPRLPVREYEEAYGGAASARLRSPDRGWWRRRRIRGRGFHHPER